MEFSATVRPGNEYAGKSVFTTTCDENEKCQYPAKTKSQCLRLFCCYTSKNKCVAKKIHFVKLCSGDSCEPKPSLPKFEVVAQKMYTAVARSYCQNKGGDLIQKDPRLYSKAGRIELSDELKLPFGNYHTGIRRDETDKNIWKRLGDGVQVNVDGWHPNSYPRQNSGYVYMYWYMIDNKEKNSIWNTGNRNFFVICEY